MIAEHFRLGRVVACRPVATGVMNLNWRVTTDRGDFAVKRVTDRPPEAFRAAQRILPGLAERGFPVPAPRWTGEGSALLQINGFRYAVSEWLPGAHPSGSGLDPAACGLLGDLAGRLHLALAELCPAAPAVLPDRPADADRTRAELRRYAGLAARRDDRFDRLAGAEIERRLVLLDTAAGQRPPDADVTPCGWTHGDLQPLNLLMDRGRVTGVLDWDRLGVRPFGLEVLRTVTIMFSAGGRTALDLERSAAFVRAYRARVPITADQLVDAADRRWWALATETWPLKRHYDDGDDRCDQLFTTRSTFLHWWSRHRAGVRTMLVEASGR
ncbi:homoserine kinase type II [Actinoplanes octamycinicus]|uniref:Homoserine kinase type II n=1 Tax=Actinoplanes octamycinicus TaxID=135948 RepID=A0A7W7MBJ1_9ACTN|nr:phosphotransferase [Actinoplanes octamycinicus]MBB4744168.1 homoserine kinase type II [Actinoplanes octamycinicus]GIE56876.1 hypothetical protein Aoc01nite_22780 [Actinoplanes octamycinicus]